MLPSVIWMLVRSCNFVASSVIAGHPLMLAVPHIALPVVRALQFKTGPEVIIQFSCSTQLSAKFHLLIKTKIQTHEEVFCFKSLRCCIYHANKC